MTLDERLNYCRICDNRRMNPAVGLVCGLTNEKPVFEPTCPYIRVDQKEADRLIALEKAAEEEENSGDHVMERKAIQKGVWGGVAMIAVAVVWFVAGLAFGRIFWYPPVLACVGIYAIIRDLYKKYERQAVSRTRTSLLNGNPRSQSQGADSKY